MAGQLKVGGNIIASHSGVEGAGEVTLQNISTIVGASLTSASLDANTNFTNIANDSISGDKISGGTLDDVSIFKGIFYGKQDWLTSGSMSAGTVYYFLTVDEIFNKGITTINSSTILINFGASNGQDGGGTGFSIVSAGRIFGTYSTSVHVNHMHHDNSGYTPTWTFNTNGFGISFGKQCSTRFAYQMLGSAGQA